ncbi:MAG: hypothetical protein JSS22_06120 [Proteobacteria bacterium]|nr:hypothetical protein [Pseudomonadota bacterium]
MGLPEQAFSRYAKLRDPGEGSDERRRRRMRGFHIFGNERNGAIRGQAIQKTIVRLRTASVFEKRIPVRVKKTRQIKIIELRFRFHQKRKTLGQRTFNGRIQHRHA